MIVTMAKTMRLSVSFVAARDDFVGGRGSPSAPLGTLSLSNGLPSRNPRLARRLALHLWLPFDFAQGLEPACGELVEPVETAASAAL